MNNYDRIKVPSLSYAKRKNQNIRSKPYSYKAGEFALTASSACVAVWTANEFCWLSGDATLRALARAILRTVPAPRRTTKRGK